MQASGTFEVEMRTEPPFLEQDGVCLFRAGVEKRFSGALDATAVVQMLGVQTAVPGSAAYVAVERIEGRLDGRSGSFVAVHLGSMASGTEQLTIQIAPDSGTGELTGIRGTMQIRIDLGQHFYTIEWTLPGQGA